MMKEIAGLMLVGLVLLSSIPAQSQTYTEQALLYSRTRPGGSARIQAMGGAQTSLGGDYSSAYSNPAGLGMYNRSEVTLTPAFNSNSTSSNYLSNTTNASKTQFVVPGFSIVLHSDKEGSTGFLGGSFAFTFNRINDFNRTFTYTGVNNKNSIIDAFIYDADGFTPDDLTPPNGSYSNNPTSLAYSNYLIEDSTFLNPGASNRHYISALGTDPNDPTDIRSQTQFETVKTTGAQNQFSVSYGANISDFLFLGAGIGFTTIKYYSTKVYTESGYHFNLYPTYNPMDNMQLNESLTTTGSGLNATLGAIVRPVDFLQVGVSYMSPTWYHTVTDSYSAAMSSQWNNFDYYGDGSKFLNSLADQTDVLISNYALTTPSRFNIGATFIGGKIGLLTGDVEFVNYSGAHYKSNDAGVDYDYDNNKIKSSFQSVVNFRVGGEIRVQAFRFRIGGGYLPSPYVSTVSSVKSDITTASLGLGYRTPKFYLDLTVVGSTGKQGYYPYYAAPVVTTTTNNYLTMLTLGFPFTR